MSSPGASMTLEPDGHREPRLATESGGSGELAALFVHATGFCKELWRPVVSRLAWESLSWFSMDQRGHGESEAGSTPREWDILARDVLELVGRRDGAGRVVAVGHSSGGTAVARAESLRPGLFRHLVLIEPIIYPPPYQRGESPLSAGALSRRSVFRSRDDARERLASGPFGSWTAEALDAYVDYGFRATDSGWELKCAPEVEAESYREGMNHDTWERVTAIDVPVTLVAGEHSITHPPSFLDSLAAQFRAPEVIVVPGAGHLLPMEDPSAVARIVRDVIATR